MQLTDVNAGGIDVGAMSYRDGVVLTSTELATLLDGATFPASHGDVPNIAVMADLTGFANSKEQLKRSMAIAAMYANTLA